jgi:hypothetical protein
MSHYAASTKEGSAGLGLFLMREGQAFSSVEAFVGKKIAPNDLAGRRHGFRLFQSHEHLLRCRHHHMTYGIWILRERLHLDMGKDPGKICGF